MDLVTGIVLLVIGAALGSWGGYRLSRRRRRADVEWVEADPLSNWTLGGVPFGFDRIGALASLVAGVVGLVLGLAVLLG